MAYCLALLLGLVPVALSQQTLWGQCGGISWTGATACVSGACCVYQNDYYSQCLSGNCQPMSTQTLTTTTQTPTTTTKLTTTTTATAQQPSGTFTNPIVYEDFADNDVFKGPDGAYYLSASNMHYSPGAPVLKSRDLVNWQIIGHSVPSLSWSSNYNMESGQTAYIKGTWASTMRYRASTKLWYWYGCIEFTRSYVYTASDPAGPWTMRATINKCYYDCGLHIDDDDIMYIVYGNNQVSISQLSSDGFSEVKSQQVFSTPSGAISIEGNRLYKRNGVYYVLDDSPDQQATYIWKSNSIWGPWSSRQLARGIGSPVTSGGSPHQGSLVEANGNWYFISFTWAYPNGRMPVMAPVTWGSDGFPSLVTVNGAWGSQYPYPLAQVDVPSWTGTDTFQGTSLGLAWEWNHNPDTSKFTVNNGLTLRTTTVTTDLFKARNTLTHRIHGANPVGIVVIDTTNMADGDIAGLAALRDQTGLIAIERSGSTYTVKTKLGLTQDPNNSWATTSLGTTSNSAMVSKGRIWLRTRIDARSNGAKTAFFDYSTDGTNFVQLGLSQALNTDWHFFMGYRFAIFNYAQKALGGSIRVESFTSA